MAGSIFLLIFSCLITNSAIHTYSILHRVFNKFDPQRFLFNQTSTKECIPVQAVKQLECPFTNKENLYHHTFQSVCEKHQLCYACGFVHGLTEEKCVRLSRMYMHEICSRNVSTQFDCLSDRFSILTLLEKDVYRSSKFSFECSDKCLFNYLYTNFE